MAQLLFFAIPAVIGSTYQLCTVGTWGNCLFMFFASSLVIPTVLAIAGSLLFLLFIIGRFLVGVFSERKTRS